MDYDLTRPEERGYACDRLHKVLVDLGVVETPI